jgi:hypothetical protein
VVELPASAVSLLPGKAGLRRQHRPSPESVSMFADLRPSAGRIRDMKLLGAMLVAAIVAPGASADIGIRWISSRSAEPGDPFSVSVDGFLGSKPWPSMPIVMVAAGQAPQVRSGGSRPAMKLRRLYEPPYRWLGVIRRWHPIRREPGHGSGVLRFAIPKASSGRYLFGLFCESCVRGPRGSLIIDYRLQLKVA